MGEVWRARDRRLDRDVALKVLPETFVTDPERLARFEREAKVLASLNHPHIGGIYGLEEAHEDGRAVKALVLELIEGPTLADRIASGPIPIDEALPIARQIAEALETAHEQGIVHRDLKPANIKVRSDGTVKVLDFGLAKALEPPFQAAIAGAGSAELSHSPTLAFAGAATQMGVILGTATYMSPEQARGRPVDKRADLWSFGCVLYEMLTGQRAFTGSEVTDTLAAVLRADPDWSALPVDTPPGVRRLLRRCLQKDPRERIRDAGDVRLELVEPVDPPGPAVAAPRRHGRALRWLFGTGALAIVVVLAVASYGVGSRRAAASHPTVEWRGEQLGGPTAFGPRISPNGQMLAFAAMVDGQTQVGIMLVGSGQWSILTSDRSQGGVFDVAWARDGASVYFDRVLDVPGGIFRVPALGGEPRLVLDRAKTPEPLEDGSIVAVRLNDQGRLQLFRFWPETGRLDALNAIVGASILEPSVRALRGGREILFYGRPLDGAADRDALCALDLESGAVRKLIESPPFRDWVFPLAATSDGEGALLQIASGNLYRIAALDGSGSARPRPLFDITSLAVNLETDGRGTIYTDLIEQPREILVLDPASGSAERIPIGNVPTSATPGVLPLPDGRVLVTTHIGGRHRLMAFTPEGGFAPLFETKEESDWPMALVGRELVALMLGSESDRVVALASTRDGRIERRLEKLNAAGIISIAGSPDGRTVYYAANGQVSAIDLETQDARELHPGEAVAVDPAGEYIVVVLSEPARRRLIKLHLSDGRVEEILVPAEMPLANVPLASNAVARDGRIAVRVAPRDSWYWPIGILDQRSGRIEKAWPDIDADMLSGGWTEDGRLVAAGWPTNSSLWRFVPEAH